MALVIISPSAGEVFCSPGTMEIQWTSDVQTSYALILLQNGIIVQTIATGVTANSYLWNIPAGLNGTDYSIVVQPAVGPPAFSPMFTIDGSAPVVNWVTPGPGDVLSGTVELVVNATDTGTGVERVEFYYRYGTSGAWQLIGVDTSEPWQIQWDTKCVFPDGSYQLRAVAYDFCEHSSETIETVVVENLPEHYVQVLLDDLLCIPAEKPDAEQIVDFKVCVEITNINVFPAYGGTKLLILGKVDIEVLYVADIPTQSVHTAHFSIPFKTFLQWKDGEPLDPCAALEPVIVCEHIEYKLLNPRTIQKYIVLFIGIKAVPVV